MPFHPAILGDPVRQPDYTATLGEGFARTRTAAFEVKLKPGWHGVEPSYLLDDERLPPYGAAYVSHEGDFIDLLCRRREVRIVRDRDKWTTVRFEYTYDTQAQQGFTSAPAFDGVPDFTAVTPGSRQPGTGGIDDLLKLPPRWSYTSEDIEIPVRRDLAFAPVVLSNGLPPDPLPTRKLAIRVITYRRYEKVWRPAFWDQYNHVVNDRPWRGRATGLVLCLPPQVAEWEEVGDTIWLPVTYTFKVMNLRAYPDWQTYVDCYSTHERRSNYDDGPQPPGTPVVYSYPQIWRYGSAVNHPWPLDANGLGVTDPVNQFPARKRFVTVPEENFDPLNILYV